MDTIASRAGRLACTGSELLAQKEARNYRAGAIPLWGDGPWVQQGTPEGFWKVKAVLLDTSVIVAMLDRSEAHHVACARIVSSLGSPLITCEAVIAESCYLLRGLRGAPEAVIENVAAGIFQIPFRLSESTSAVKAYLRKYRDRSTDLADACLICMAEEFGTGEILTLDHDFDVYRWGRNKPFQRILQNPR